MNVPGPGAKTLPCQCPALDLLAMLQDGTLSATGLLDSCIARIEALDPALNAVVTTCFEQAHREAHAADEAMRAGRSLGVLHGLPLLVKDLADTAGVRTTYGSLCFAEAIPSSDSVTVNRLRRAGAILIGKTNTPEFGAGANTCNRVFGATCNPFERTLTCGGSSGGSAVALACDMAPLATGSDLGGSLRIPASYCSVVGMRPSPGRVPSVAHVCGFSPLWTDGPMARNVRDVALGLSVMAGHDKRDPLSYREAGAVFESASQATCLMPAELDTLTVAFSTDLGVADVGSDIAALFTQRAERIGDWFGAIGQPSIQVDDAATIFRTLRAESMYAAFAPLAAAHGAELSDNVLANLREAASLTVLDTATAHAAHTRLFRRFQIMFDDIDVLICPATAVSPFPIEQPFPATIDGRPLNGYFAWYAITWVLSLTGCPIVTIPCGRDAAGLPFGIQVIGPRHEDGRTLRIALALETALDAAGIGRVAPDTDAIHRAASR